MRRDYLEVGKIVSTHGIKGEVRVDPWCDGPAFLKQFKTLYYDKNGARPVAVKACRPHSNIAILKLEGVDTVEAAAALRVPNIIATVGNERADVSRERQHETCVETLRRLGELARPAGVQIVLEPLNVLVNHKGYFLVTSAEGFRMIDEVKDPSVKLLFDIYHQQVSEGNLIANITANIDKIGHFHIADNPGRREPGTGEIAYANVFASIAAAGYEGYLAFECGRSVDVELLCERMHALIDPFTSWK